MLRGLPIYVVAVLLCISAAGSPAATSWQDQEARNSTGFHYDVVTYTPAKDAKILEPYFAGTQGPVMLRIKGSTPGARDIELTLPKRIGGPQAVTDDIKLTDINIGYPCSITLEALSEDAWKVDSVTVAYMFRKTVISTETFGRTERIGWIDKDCFADISSNLAILPGVEAKQTGDYGAGYEAERAIDNVTDGSSMSHTGGGVNPASWQANLRKPALVSKITLWPRELGGDTHGTTPKNYIVMLLLSEGSSDVQDTVWSQYYPGQLRERLDIAMPAEQRGNIVSSC